MSYRKRFIPLFSMDFLIALGSVYVAYMLRFDGDLPVIYIKQMIIYMTVTVFFSVVSMSFFKLYNRIWQYASVGEMLSIFRAVVVSSSLSYIVSYFISGIGVPISIFLGTFQSMLFLMGGARFAWRLFRDNYYKQKQGQHKALIIGAGDCGTIIARELKHNSASQMYPIAFIDDDLLKHKHQIYGLPVLGNREAIIDVTEAHDISDIVIAIPSATKKQITEIIEICKKTKAKLKIIPKLSDLIHGKVSIQEIRDVDVEDLLGRDPVKVDLHGIADYLSDKSVLVTGAGGSIGSELCRQIASFNPSKLLLLGHGENSIYAIEMELSRLFPKIKLGTIIADIQDQKRLETIFKEFLPQVVFHAAAHKHVPLMEKNPTEAIKNNVLGTRNVADCADKFGSERFVLISTDKAVNPTSVMGTTKRIAEMYIQSLNMTSKTIFAAVRFGNVLGSRGSVIPQFKQQIAHGGPVTVTHPEMIRYFMTIPEAVQLVIQAGAIAQGGEVFILDMGEPVKILNLAKDLIRLSGFVPNEDIAIQYTGMRPGEKLYEELLTSEEGLTSTLHNRIFIGRPANLNREHIQFEVKKLEKLLGDSVDDIRSVLQHIVPTYNRPSNQEAKELTLV
ncbi:MULTISPECIES: nucleoside-diphosphate sugar epimerase/dehydratase [unclassified Paenibacillus]|uniref:polysaccharide biosynthesis protein n=1 Tax=unclassified Paenibacillus TaxID=185978 RepID=UPI00020D71E6|nr:MULTISPECIES: nucleoside-diphosphate sugar epimerase/dehydratase [unclassified Paenibacillus]EGL19485.1 polysaccharide biosynthesis protein [Paenibacillus sp. HGF7]EPD82526.1 hypothetical protein HMPREF1207_03318 [Paenibacillus sp. HGH0039]